MFSTPVPYSGIHGEFSFSRFSHSVVHPGNCGVNSDQRLPSVGDNDGRSQTFLLQHCALPKVYVIDGHTTRDLIPLTSYRRSKRA